jgi:hypothetical protein
MLDTHMVSISLLIPPSHAETPPCLPFLSSSNKPRPNISSQKPPFNISSKYLYHLSSSIPIQPPGIHSPTSICNSSLVPGSNSNTPTRCGPIQPLHISCYPSLLHSDRDLCTGGEFIRSSNGLIYWNHLPVCHRESLAKYELQNNLRFKYIPYRDKCRSPRNGLHCECFSRPLFLRLRGWMKGTGKGRQLRFCRRCEKFTLRRRGKEGACKYFLL